MRFRYTLYCNGGVLHLISQRGPTGGSDLASHRLPASPHGPRPGTTTPPPRPLSVPRSALP
eukprot:3372777-Rhodomonas_salina.5